MKITKEMGHILPDTTITSGNPVAIDIRREPFALEGLCAPYCRVPADIAEATSENVAKLALDTAGARVRFITDSDYIAIHAETVPDLNVMRMTDMSGFDLYTRKDGKFKMVGSLSASQGTGKNYVEGRLRLDSSLKEVIIYFPLFDIVKSLSVILREGCELSAPPAFSDKKPVVFYGSSIVHGVGSSRAGNSYPAIISRRLGLDFFNLGFAGAAKAEPAIIDYIASLDMSAFVYDYDHNAPSADYLESTHYAGYKRFRAVHPDTPVIFASKPDYYNDPDGENKRRRNIIMESYRRGKAEGDKNLWFIDGKTMYEEEYREEATFDGCHPNDLGYLYMANKIGAALKEALSL